MEPKYLKNDILLVENFSLNFFAPKRGEVIVYKDPRDKNHPFVIKRIIGMPNEKLFIENDLVSVVDKNNATTTFPLNSLLGGKDNGKDFSIILGPEDYFLMGDNRAGSKDSRETGTIQKHEMYGRPYFRLSYSFFK